MVQVLLSDVCIEAQVRVVIAIMASPYWEEYWNALNLRHCTFRDVGLAPETPDSSVWDYCQREQMVLITANRNQDGPDSLETTIRTRNTPDSLPVFTMADSEEVFHSRAYADRVAEKLIDSLLVLDDVRGAGRIWLP